MNKKSLTLTALVMMLVLIVFSACKQEELATVYNEDEAELNIFTTLYPIQFILEEIGEDLVTVESIYPPGVDAHTYEPTTKEMTEIAKSDAFFYFGPTMEGFTESAAEALANEDVQLISLEQHEALFVGPQMEQNEEEDPDHDEIKSTDRNPHVWIDPLRMMEMANIITDKLIEIAPEHEEVFEQNKLDLIVQFQKLEDSFKQQVVPKENKYLIVPHAAYDYWEDRYGIEQIAISGLTPSEEPSQKYLSEIITMAEERRINYLFYEQNTPDQLIEIVQDELAAETYPIHNLSVLTEDDIQNEENYITLMEQNIEILAEVFPE